MSRRPMRRWIVLSALALVTVGELGPRWLPVARAEDHLKIRGHASGLSQVATASTTTTFTLSGKAAMSSASDNSCQGAVFTIPVTLTGSVG